LTKVDDSEYSAAWNEMNDEHHSKNSAVPAELKQSKPKSKPGFMDKLYGSFLTSAQGHSISNLSLRIGWMIELQDIKEPRTDFHHSQGLQHYPVAHPHLPRPA
jgi:hypothetical protein